MALACSSLFRRHTEKTNPEQSVEACPYAGQHPCLPFTWWQDGQHWQFLHARRLKQWRPFPGQREIVVPRLSWYQQCTSLPYASQHPQYYSACWWHNFPLWPEQSVHHETYKHRKPGRERFSGDVEIRLTWQVQYPWTAELQMCFCTSLSNLTTSRSSRATARFLLIGRYGIIHYHKRGALESR